MRASEFITESRPGTTRKPPDSNFETAHPGLVGPDGSQDIYWGRYYDFYRVASLAGMDIKDIEKEDSIGFFGNLPAFSAYTEHDREKLKAIMKKMGMKPKDRIGKGSTELPDTYKVSPVVGFKGFK